MALYRRSLLGPRVARTSSKRYVLAVHLSPWSFADKCFSPVQMLRMFNMYRDDNNNVEFKFLHVFARLEMCEK